MRRIALNPLAAQIGCAISEDVSRVGRYVNKTKPGVITQQDENTTHSPMMQAAEANMLATKKMIPTEPPNSRPSALLIMTDQG